LKRRAGELLREMEKNKGGQAEQKTYQSHDATSTKPPKLKDIGTSKFQNNNVGINCPKHRR